MLRNFLFSEVPNHLRHTTPDHSLTGLLPGMDGERVDTLEATVPMPYLPVLRGWGSTVGCNPISATTLFNLESGAFKRREGELFSVVWG